MDNLDRELEEGEDSTGSAMIGYLGGRDDEQMSERSILEGLEKWIEETIKEGGKDSSKKVVIDSRCISIWARLCANKNKTTKEAVMTLTVSWESFIKALESVLKRWTKVENTTSRELNDAERKVSARKSS